MSLSKTWQDINKTSPTIAERMDSGLTSQRGNPSLREAIISSISRGKLVTGATDNYDGNNLNTKVQKFTNPFWIETLVLSRRSFLNARRLPELLMVRFGVAILSAFIFATVFWNLDISPQGNRERATFLGFSVSSIFYFCGDGYVFYLDERRIIIRETAYNSYRKFSYWLSNSLVWLPSLFLLSVTFSVITFFGVGLSGGLRAFLFYWGMVFSSFWTGNAFVTLVIELVPRVLLGFIVLNVLLSSFLFFTGLFITRDRIPSYWIWNHYLSLKKYTFQALMQNEFGEPAGKCFLRAIQSFDNSPLGSASIELKEKFLESAGEILGMNITGSTCVATGADILKDRGITDLSKWESFWIIIAWGFFFKILFYFALLRKNRK